MAAASVPQNGCRAEGSAWGPPGEDRWTRSRQGSSGPLPLHSARLASPRPAELVPPYTSLHQPPHKVDPLSAIVSGGTYGVAAFRILRRSSSLFASGSGARGTYHGEVATEDQSPTPLLDEWIAEAGEHQVAAAMRTAVDEIRNGTARDMIDRDAYAAYVARRRQRSAS